MHPEITLKGKEGPSLKNTIKHQFVENISGLFEKFNHWTHLKALDLIDSKKIDNENLFRNIRRVLTRFLKNYYKRRVYSDHRIINYNHCNCALIH